MANETEFGFPDGWEDSGMVSSFKRNKDGSVTARVQIYLSSPDGGTWVTYREMRLKKEKRKEAQTDDR